MGKKDKSEKYEEETIVSLRSGFSSFNKRFKNEREFDENIADKLPFLIKRMYGLEVTRIAKQKVFDLTDFGYYKIIVDFYIETKEGKSFIIESKNPFHKKSEMIIAIGQIMSYDFLMNKMGLDCEVILATSYFDFKYLELMAYFNLKFDLILNNEDSVAYWINEWK